MRSYGQYCPIARSAGILAERWTPIIMRNLVNGDTTFTELVADAPGIPRTLLRARLQELARMGLVRVAPHPRGRGSVYSLTEAGADVKGVLEAMGLWAERWLDVTDVDAEPGYTLHSWLSRYLAVEQLPDRRVVVRFDFPARPERTRHFWFVFDGDASEICRTDPGYGEDLVVTADARVLAMWHLGRITWGEALRSGGVAVAGPPSLAAALPRWNRRSAWALPRYRELVERPARPREVEHRPVEVERSTTWRTASPRDLRSSSRAPS